MARLGNTDINGVAYVRDDLTAYRDIILLSKSGHTPVRIINTSDKLTITRTSDGNNLLDVDNTTIKYKTNKIWHEGNDGSGSGLDADLLDGLQATAFFKKTGDTKLTFAANQYFINNSTHVGNYAANINNSDIIGMKNIFFSGTGNGLFFNKTGAHSTDPNSYIKFYVDANGRAIVNNNHIITKADYGHGKGINADMLDDKHATDFATSSHNHDSNYLKLTGGTMTGHITYAGNVTYRETGVTSSKSIWISADNDANETGTAAVRLTASVGHGNTQSGLAVFKDNITFNNNKVWHAGNDGSGSTLDADLLDGKHASAFALTDHNHDTRNDGRYLKLTGGTLTGRVTVRAGVGHVTTNGSINMSNENITNINALVFDDECDSAAEGVLFPKKGVAGSSNLSDYNTLRVLGNGDLMVGTKKYLSEMENVPSNAFVALGAMDMTPYIKALPNSGATNIKYTYYRNSGRTKIECTGPLWGYIDIPIPASQIGYHYTRLCIKCLSYNGTAGSTNAYVGITSFDKEGNILSTDKATAYNYIWNGNIPVGEYRSISGHTQGVNNAEGNDRNKFDPQVAYYKVMFILNFNNPGAGSFELYEFESGLIPYAVQDKLRFMSIGGTGGRPTGTTRINFNGYMYTNRLYGAVWNDYAEYFEKGDTIEPGDVVELDMNSEEERYIKTTESYSSNVVGVCSDEYGQCLGGNGDEHDEENFAPIGLAGRVRVKLIGKARKGDLLTSSNIPGVAMVANPEVDTRGRIIGKCLENKETEEIQRTRMLIQLS